MAKCWNCNVEILDETEYCPLCQSILDPTDELENMYPNVRVKIRRMHLFSRIYLFLSILLTVVLYLVDRISEPHIWWSIIGLILFYFYLVLRYTILGKSGYRTKVTTLVVLSILIAVAADFIMGYQGWSVDYVLPAGILFVDCIVLFCMFWNHRNWQSYLMWQLLMILCSLIPAGLSLAELEHHRNLAFLPLFISLTIFLGTLIIGDRQARMELIRRFHH